MNANKRDEQDQVILLHIHNYCACVMVIVLLVSTINVRFTWELMREVNSESCYIHMYL